MRLLRMVITSVIFTFMIADGVIALGGTSLLNANVFLEADARTLQLPNWPKEIRQRPESIKKCKSDP